MGHKLYWHISLIYLKTESSKNLSGFSQIGTVTNVDTILIFEGIRKELEGYLLEQSDDTDSTDGVLDFLAALSDKIWEEFEELLDGDSDKKRFLMVLTRIFALLLNTKVDMPEKIKKILKIAIETTVKLWSGQN